MKKKEVKVTSEGRESLFGSIKGKVIFMGVLSILASVILGVAGLQSLSKNSVNNEVLAKINNINLLQYENQSLDTSYLYFLDDSYLEQIINNLAEMEENAKTAVELTSGSQKTQMDSVLANITACKANYEQIRALCQQRGFTSDVGSFAEFQANDAALTQDFTTVANDKAWVDGKWVNAYDDGTRVEADGTVYTKMVYTSDIPQVGKRDNFLPRLGGNGMIYDGTIYIANLTFSGSNGEQKVDFSTVDMDALNSASYGDGLDAMEVSSIEGNSALKITTSFTGADGGWEEITIKMPAKDYNIQNYTTVTYDVYFEDIYPEGMQAACALSDKYAFADNLNSVNSAVTSYSKSVVEGKDVTEQITSINAILDEITANVSDYVNDDTLKSSILGNMEAKKTVFSKMSESDTTVLALKQDNIAISAALTEETSGVRAGIEADTNATKTSLTLVITVILIVSAAILVLITLAVSRSMNRSVRKFQEALHQVMDGNLNVRADIRSKDEFAVFGRTLNVFLEKLTGIIQSAQSISENVSSSGDELREMSTSTSETSSEIERAVEDISRGAASQAEDIEEASGSIVRGK